VIAAAGPCGSGAVVVPAAIRSPSQPIAIGLAACVAASHLEAAVSALPRSPVVGVAVAAIAVVAGAWAVRVARGPSRALLLAGAGGAAALVALWLWTRTLGVPGVGGGVAAPIGVLDALSALDALLLAGFATGAARSAGRAPRERWPVVGCVAISVSCIALAMGCEPSATASASSPAGPAPGLVCHLY
jgi:hypothetical protein